MSVCLCSCTGFLSGVSGSLGFLKWYQGALQHTEIQYNSAEMTPAVECIRISNQCSTLQTQCSRYWKSILNQQRLSHMAVLNEILSKWGQLWAHLGISGGYERKSEPLQHVARHNTEKHEWQTHTTTFVTLSTDGSKLGGNGTGWGEGCGWEGGWHFKGEGWALPTATSHTSWDWQSSVSVVTVTSMLGLSLTFVHLHLHSDDWQPRAPPTSSRTDRHS